MGTSPRISIRAALLVWLLTVISFFLAVWMSWTGFLGSDDALYADAALRWLSQGPFVGTSHFSLRLTTVLPLVLSFKLLGIRELALILPTLLCGIAVTAILAFLAIRILGMQQALYAIVLFVTVPLFASMNSSPGVDLTELVFDLSSLCLFVVALERGRRAGLLFLCGLLAGLGWISRETSIFLALYYGLLFLVGFRIPRREYLLIAAGFLTIALGEMFVYYLVTGDAFHRLKISLHHDLVKRDATHSLFDREGNLHIDGFAGTFLNPLLMIFCNKVFGILFWLSIPAAIWLFRSPRIPLATRTALQAVTLSGIVWMLGVFVLVGKLYLVPRYMLFPLCTASLIVGAWLALDVFPRSSQLAFTAIGAALVVNLIAINLEDHSYMFPERTLVNFTKSTSERVYTDHETFRRSLFLLQCENLGGQVSDQQHSLGDLFFYVPDNAGFKERITGHEPTWRAPVASYSPLRGERIVAKFDRPERWLARTLESVGASNQLPLPLMAKLRGNQGAVFVYSTRALSQSHPFL